MTTNDCRYISDRSLYPWANLIIIEVDWSLVKPNSYSILSIDTPFSKNPFTWVSIFGAPLSLHTLIKSSGVVTLGNHFLLIVSIDWDGCTILLFFSIWILLCLSLRLFYFLSISSCSNCLLTSSLISRQKNWDFYHNHYPSQGVWFLFFIFLILPQFYHWTYYPCEW